MGEDGGEEEGSEEERTRPLNQSGTRAQRLETAEGARQVLERLSLDPVEETRGMETRELRLSTRCFVW